MKKQEENSLYELNKTAEIYLAQGKLEEVITACNQVLEIVPDFPPIYKTLGNIFHLTMHLF
ncbi:MAG: hypothetical protein F6K17_36105 [Okeania sp. SIO3C4]|nr:hypothetical protein [Okeania sp. SIO3B3]NER07605.1 hypothetical protein [Okeania sp. SIO3C4]